MNAPQGNTELVEYGILQERSDYRAHVCVLARRVYVFETRRGRAAVRSGGWSPRRVFTQGICTAIGVLVPVTDLTFAATVDLPDRFKDWLKADMDTTEKGRRACQCVVAMLRDGRIPFRMAPRVEHHPNIQIEGVDLVVVSDLRIQVKCDYRGGEKSRGGTGNLFLQTHECNPFQRY